MIRYLLDTDTCIEILRHNPPVVERFRSVGVKQTAVSPITLAELYFGAHNSPRVQENLDRVAAFLTYPAPTILPFDAEAANVFGAFKTALRSSGRPVSDFDIMIAATAKRYGLILVTGNLRHFHRFGSVFVESWYDRAQ